MRLTRADKTAILKAAATATDLRTMQLWLADVVEAAEAAGPGKPAKVPSSN